MSRSAPSAARTAAGSPRRAGLLGHRPSRSRRAHRRLPRVGSGRHRGRRGLPRLPRDRIYPPAGAGPADWVVIVHFDDAANLRPGSTRRCGPSGRPGCRRAPRLPAQDLAGGFRPVVRRAVSTIPTASPPSWKMALTVLLGLYPTVMLLSISGRTVPGPPRHGGLDAGEQRPERVDPPVGGHAGAPTAPSPLAQSPGRYSRPCPARSSGWS